MENIVFPVELMRLGYIFVPGLIISFIVFSFVDNSLVKFIIYMLKMLAYFGLAYYMWKYYQSQTQIGFISLFTFIFCCLEATDNFVSMISIPINYGRKMKRGAEEIYKNDAKWY